MAEQIATTDKVITLEAYQQAKRDGKTLDPDTLVLVPISEFESELEVIEPEYPDEQCVEAVYQHLLYFESEDQVETAKETLMTHRPRVIRYQSIEAREDGDGDSLLEIQTKGRLDSDECRYIERTVWPAFHKFNQFAVWQEDTR